MMNHYAMEMLLKHRQNEIEQSSRQAWKWSEQADREQRKLSRSPAPVAASSLSVGRSSQASACCAAACC